MSEPLFQPNPEDILAAPLMARIKEIANNNEHLGPTQGLWQQEPFDTAVHTVLAMPLRTGVISESLKTPDQEAEIPVSQAIKLFWQKRYGDIILRKLLGDPLLFQQWQQGLIPAEELTRRVMHGVITEIGVLLPTNISRTTLFAEKAELDFMKAATRRGSYTGTLLAAITVKSLTRNYAEGKNIALALTQELNGSELALAYIQEMVNEYIVKGVGGSYHASSWYDPHGMPRSTEKQRDTTNREYPAPTYATWVARRIQAEDIYAKLLAQEAAGLARSPIGSVGGRSRHYFLTQLGALD